MFDKESWGNNFDFLTVPDCELYDLEKYLHEMNNVYLQKQYNKVIEDMRKQLKKSGVGL